MTDFEKGWLAGITDGDGYWRLSKRCYPSKVLGKRYSYTIGLEVATTNPEIAKHCFDITEMGSLKWYTRKHKDILKWRIGPKELRKLIPEIAPYCIKKEPFIVMEALKLVNQPRVSRGPNAIGYIRNPKNTERLDELVIIMSKNKSRDYLTQKYINESARPNSLEIRDLR